MEKGQGTKKGYNLIWEDRRGPWKSEVALLSIKDQHRTAEGSPSDDDSYLGYSGSDFVFKFSLNSIRFSLMRENDSIMR